MDSDATLESLACIQDVPDEMLRELQRELDRNAEASRLVKERERQAIDARMRAAESQKRMQGMVAKYDEMRTKLEITRRTLLETHNRIVRHDNSRSEKIRDSVAKLKERADVFTDKLREKLKAKDLMPGPGGDVSDDGEGLTDAERMLLLLCQEQASHKTSESELSEKNDDINEDDDGRNPMDQSVHQNTVQSIQEKLSSRKPSSERTPTTEQDTYANRGVTPEANNSGTDGAEIEEETERWKTETKLECFADNPVGVELSILNGEVCETVTALEDDGAATQNELGQMAMSEQYMRTKQAQLMAKKKEKEAQLAMERAIEREREAEKLRDRVENMMKLLQQKREKLKATEDVADKKGKLVEKVTLLLDSKQKKRELRPQPTGRMLGF